MNYIMAEQAARLMLGHLGIRCDDELEATPMRLVHALAELTSSVRDGFDPAPLLARQFAAPDELPQMVIMQGVPFASLCEHHMLPFTGTAAIAYLPQPGAKVVGASKLPRVLAGFAARPQMQERLGALVVGAIGKHMDVQGAGCVIRGEHTCMTLRGACATGATMLTSHLTGCFLDTPVRSEFLALTR